MARPVTPEPAEPAEPVEPTEPSEVPLDEPTFEMRLPGPRPAEPEPEREPEPEPEPAQKVTDKGLPKRTPKVVQAGPAKSQERKGGTDAAEALRRRLGGFQQGAKEGRRDVAAELEETDQQADTDTGETVEEVRR